MVAGWGMVVGGVALSFLHAPWKVQGQWDARAFAYVAFILIFGTLLPFIFINSACRLIGAQMSILLTCAEPLSAAVLAVWWLGVAWGAMDWLGTVCVLATIVLLAKEQSPEAQAEKLPKQFLQSFGEGNFRRPAQRGLDLGNIGQGRFGIVLARSVWTW